jgi:hypothetical protein
MGTWGSGIYDNDHALDRLAELVEPFCEAAATSQLPVGLGLLAWLLPSHLGTAIEHHRGQFKSVPSDMAGWSDDTLTAIEALLADPEAATQERGREAAASEAIGSYSNGPRIEPLLRAPGGQAVIEALAARAAGHLDHVLARTDSLYELAGELAALGVLIELATGGFSRPAPARVAAWRAGFDAADRRTSEERGFWDRYVVRVRHGFDLLAP